MDDFLFLSEGLREGRCVVRRYTEKSTKRGGGKREDEGGTGDGVESKRGGVVQRR